MRVAQKVLNDGPLCAEDVESLNGGGKGVTNCWRFAYVIQI
jgi:hypothetical protein